MFQNKLTSKLYSEKSLTEIMNIISDSGLSNLEKQYRIEEISSTQELIDKKIKFKDYSIRKIPLWKNKIITSMLYDIIIDKIDKEGLKNSHFLSNDLTKSSYISKKIFKPLGFLDIPFNLKEALCVYIFNLTQNMGTNFDGEKPILDVTLRTKVQQYLLNSDELRIKVHYFNTYYFDKEKGFQKFLLNLLNGSFDCFNDENINEYFKSNININNILSSEYQKSNYYKRLEYRSIYNLILEIYDNEIEKKVEPNPNFIIQKILIKKLNLDDLNEKDLTIFLGLCLTDYNKYYFDSEDRRIEVISKYVLALQQIFIKLTLIKTENKIFFDQITRKVKTNKIIIPSNSFEHILYDIKTSIQFPMVCEPLNWTHQKNDGGYLFNDESKKDFLIKKLTQGVSEARLSNETLKTLNIIQSKRYRVNENARFLFYSDYLLKMLNLPSEIDFKNLTDKITLIDTKIAEEYDHLYKVWHNEIHAEPGEIKGSFKSFLKLKLEQAEINFESRKQQNKLQSHEKIDLIKKQIYKKYYLTETLSFLLEEKIKQQRLRKKMSLDLLMYFFTRDVYFLFLSNRVYFYFVNFFCFRLRFYPRGWVLHRATGFWKYLLETPRKHAYNQDGVDWLLIFLSVRLGKNFKTRDEYIDYSTDLVNGCMDQTNFIDMFENFFKNHQISLDNRSNNDSFLIHAFDSFHSYCTDTLDLVISEKNFLPLYLSFCEFFYLKYYSYKSGINFGYSSGFMIDVDQSSSGPQIVSLLSRDKDLAFYTNILSEYDKQDLYIYFIKNFKNILYNNYPNLKLKETDIDFCDKIFDRDFGKEFVMPFFYSQGTIGRKEKLKKLLNKPECLEFNKKIDPTFEFKEFTSNYVNAKTVKILENFIIQAFKLSGINSNYFKLYLNFVDILYRYYKSQNLLSSGSIRFRTLTDDLIIYRYTETIRTVTSWKNPESKKLQKIYNYRQGKVWDNSKNKAFFVHFIQSIDASIARILVKSIFDKYKIRIEPLHDSFKTHPVYVDKVILELKIIYFSIFSTEDEFKKTKKEFEVKNPDIYNTLLAYDDRFKRIRKEGLFKVLVIDPNMGEITTTSEYSQLLIKLHNKERSFVQNNPNYFEFDLDHYLRSDFTFFP